MYDLAKLCNDKLCKSAFQKKVWQNKQKKKTEKEKKKKKNKHQSGHSTRRYWNGLHLGSSSYSQNQT